MKCHLILLLCAGMLIAGCAQTATDPEAPSNSIEAYLAALVAKDSETFNTLFCADYESEALIEFDSFGAVDAELEDATCTTGESTDAGTVVTCAGSIKIVYDGETNNSLDLSRTPYLAVQEDGEWKMCGYS